MPLDEEVHEAILKAFSDLLETSDDVVDALQASGFPDKAKRQITALLQQPRQRIGMMVDAINANPPAFEHAYTKLEPEIHLLLEQLEEQVRKGNHPTLSNRPSS